MRLATPLFLIGMSLTACSGSQFAGGGATADGKPNQKKDATTVPPKGQELGNPDDESESDPAEDPVMVSGAYLTCVADDKLPGDANDVTIGCVAKVDDQKMDLSQFEEIKWATLDVFNSETPHQFVDAPADSPYHATVKLPRQRVDLLTIRMTAKKGGKTADLFAKIPPIAGDVVPDDKTPQPNTKDFGKDKDYQLGDDSYGSQGHYCNDQLQQIGLSGSSLSFTITVKTDTKVAVTLGKMCGVDRALNYIQINDSALNRLFNEIIPRNSHDFAIPAIELKAGTYTLDIVSPKWGPGTSNPDDRDDFVVGDFRFIFDGNIEVSDPVANQFMEP